MKPAKEEYISTKEVAALTGLDRRSVRRKCQRGDYEVRERKSRKGGIKYMIAVRSLPEEVKAAYNGKQTQGKKGGREALPAMVEWKRAAAIERLEIIKEWERYAGERGKSPGGCVEEFCKEKGGKYTRPTLYRWRRSYKEGGLTALAPDWKNVKKPLSDEVFSRGAKEFMRDFWLHPNLPSMKLAYDVMKEEARKKGWKVPSYTTAKQLLSQIPEAVKAKHRKGTKYMEDRIYPYLERDNAKLKPMQIIVADHHQLDIATRMPDGRIIFPWLTGWKDLRTNKILSWVIVSQPNGDSINISLHQMITKFGIGDWLYLDNGKDFRQKLFTGEGRKNWAWSKKKIRIELKETEWEGIYKELGYKGVIWAKPYNAKAKKIERYFKEVVNRFSVFFRSFRGRKVEERPEGLQGKIRRGDVVEFETLKRYMHQFIDIRYNGKRVHRGKGMEGRTPNQVYYEMKTQKRSIREEELVILMSKVHKPKQVRQQGVQMFSGWYWNDRVQMSHFGEKVNIRYIEDRLDRVYIFDMNWKYLGTGERRPGAEFFMESEEYRKNLRYKAALKDSIKGWEAGNLPEKRMSGISREMLLDGEEIQETEPELETRYVRTKYADLVVADEQEKEKRKKKSAAQDSLKTIYANLGTEESYNVLIEKEVANFLIEYGNQGGTK